MEYLVSPIICFHMNLSINVESISIDRNISIYLLLFRSRYIIAIYSGPEY